MEYICWKKRKESVLVDKGYGYWMGRWDFTCNLSPEYDCRHCDFSIPPFSPNITHCPSQNKILFFVLQFYFIFFSLCKLFQYLSPSLLYDSSSPLPAMMTASDAQGMASIAWCLMPEYTKQRPDRFGIVLSPTPLKVPAEMRWCCVVLVHCWLTMHR
jgi:hypothetical protein